MTSWPAAASSATAAVPPAPAPITVTFMKASMCGENALRLEHLTDLPDVLREARILVHVPPAARARYVDHQVQIDPPRARRHDEDAVGQEHRFVDPVGDEENGVPEPQPHMLQVHDHLLAR